MSFQEKYLLMHHMVYMRSDETHAIGRAKFFLPTNGYKDRDELPIRPPSSVMFWGNEHKCSLIFNVWNDLERSNFLRWGLVVPRK